MNFYTADQHFGHANILKHQSQTRVDAKGRVFRSIQDHDAYLIEQWNAKVGKGDTVYCLGDFSFKLETAEAVLRQLNGAKILVMGNHDAGFKGWVNGESGWADKEDNKLLQSRAALLNAGFAEVLTSHLMALDGKILCLSHFPYQTSEPLPGYEAKYSHLRPEPDSSECLLHGHIHVHWKLARYSDTPPMLNVGVDMHQLAPVSECEVLAGIKMHVEPASHPSDGLAY